MKTIGTHNYYTYIITNKYKTVLYIGVTNNLNVRLQQHYQNSLSDETKSFTAKYNVFFLLYYDRFENIVDAIKREKQLKGWTRKKKDDLISASNPKWRFLNDEI